MHKYTFFLYLLLACLLAACGGSGRDAKVESSDSITFKYAKLIHIYNHKNYKVVIVNNPWKTDEVLHRYILVAKGEHVNSLPEGTVVRTPLQRLTVFTSVHVGLMDEIGAVGNVSGVCDFEYIRSKHIISLVKAGKITNMGSALSPNVELILSGHTDGMLVSPFDKSGYGTLERTDIPLIECADYMEKSALGRAEWMRFFGMLVNREKTTDSMFESVERRYLGLIHKVANAKGRPTLLSDCLNGAAWYVPGGESTIGKIYQDAGADYLFAHNKENGSVRLSFETVYQKAHNAAFWFIKYGRPQDYSYENLKKDDPRYASFSAFKNRHIYGCNTLLVPFYDEEPFHPDVLLSDVVSILHPEVLPNYKRHFFKPLK